MCFPVWYALLRLFHWWLIASLICWCTFAFGYWLFIPWLALTAVYWVAIAIFFVWGGYVAGKGQPLEGLFSGWLKTGIYLGWCTFVFGLGFGWFKWWVIASVVYWIASGCAISILTRRT